MIRPVLQYPDPRLARKSVEIKEITPEIRELAADMVETMYARDGIGLAAPQVGEAVRLITVDISGPEKREALHILVNPKLTLGPGEVASEEGCLSVPELRADVYRAPRLTLEATDLDGKPIRMEADELLAICLQHECDHLDGKLFIDRISRLKRMMYDRKIDKKAQK